MRSAIFILATTVLAAGAAYPQTTTVTKTAPKPVSVPIGNTGASIAPSTTTIYTQPGKGADGSIPGSQAGSRTDTGYGATVTIPLPEKK